MSDECDFLSFMDFLPAEILLNIFINLPAKDLIKCREVCVRWNLIVDELARGDDLWTKYCKQDFNDIYKIARKKSKPSLSWYHLYRSLALWGRVVDAIEYNDEFASAFSLNEEIRNFEILGNGIIGIHKKGSIVYYDIETLKQYPRAPIEGDYSRYKETDKVIVALSFQLRLILIRKDLVTTNQEESCVTFNDVKLFTLTDDALYFVNLNDEIYKCSFEINKLETHFLKKSEDGIMSLGYSDRHLNILTFQRNIYKIIDKEMVFICALGPDSNLLHQLCEFSFLDQLDWRVYFQWMNLLNHSVPDGPLRDIIIIRQYGPVYFVGSNWGVLRIYYAPYSKGQFDIFNTQPVKQYNFMDSSDCSVISTCPILQVDVFEQEDGHTLFVAMPKKMAVLNFKHIFKSMADDAAFQQPSTSSVYEDL